MQQPNVDDSATTSPRLSPDRGRPRGRNWWLIRAFWVAGLVVAAVAFRAALPELRKGIGAISQAHLGLLTLAVVVQGVALATLPLTYRAALRLAGGNARYGDALNATLGAFALSRVVPAGGLAGGLYAARRFVLAGNATAVAGATVSVASAVTMLALGMVVAGGVVLELASGRGSAALLWSVTAFIAALVAAFVLLVRVMRNPRQLDRLCSGIGRVLRRPDEAEALRRYLTELAPTLSEPSSVARVTGWAVLNWALQLAALWIVFVAFGVAMPLGVLILGFGAANLVTALPHTPGGLGVVEAGMTATYVALGVPTATALVGVLCYRLLGHWLPVVAALPLVLPQVRRPSGRDHDSPRAIESGEDEREPASGPENVRR
jgi:putative heme transporter